MFLQLSCGTHPNVCNSVWFQLPFCRKYPSSETRFLARFAVATILRRHVSIKAYATQNSSADCVGDLGAAIVPCMIGVACAAGEAGYSEGPGVLFHCANDDAQRAALIGRFIGESAGNGQ